MTSQARIPVAAPILDGRETEYVLECLQSGWISSIGHFIGDFERAFADYCGVRHAVACSNGTTALHLALVALGVTAGDEVIVPALTYIASANTVTYCGATPVFVDCDPITFNMDPAQIEAKITPRTKAIMPVHLYGHPVDMGAVREIARRRGLKVVEDAAEAIGATYRGQMTGSLGDCAAFSFFGNKIITTGEGGMVTTDDDALAARLRLFRSQGMDPDRRYWFPVIGYNYRLTNVAAAIGLAQLERVDAHLASRRWVAEGYDRRLAAFSPQIVRPATAPWAQHVFWMYTVLLPSGGRLSRDAVIAALEAQGIETRPVFCPLPLLPPYKGLAQGPFPNAVDVGERGLNLPTHGRLTDADLDRVVSALGALLA
jgi:perosamine synthetase